MNYEQAYGILFSCLLAVLGLALLLVFFRAVKGPKAADRIIAVNMMGSLTIAALAVLAVYTKALYLLDVCLIYVLISFLAVIALCRIYINVYLKQHPEKIESKERRHD